MPAEIIGDQAGIRDMSGTVLPLGKRDHRIIAGVEDHCRRPNSIKPEFFYFRPGQLSRVEIHTR